MFLCPTPLVGRMIQFVNLKNNIEEFQISEFSFPVGILVQLNELVEGDGIIVN